ncbi:MAG: FAD-dependent oxidoreductase, partial [Acidobacteriota bacterium]|nr:FAD-dependent oxidoreductase [Acidobacteriota bacterium]
GLAAIRVFIVAEEARRLLGASDREITDLARADLRRLMGIAAQPRFSSLYRWPDSMPQYVVGHRARHQSIKQELSALPNLHLVGNAYDGVGIPDCVRLSKDVAMNISQIKSS